MELYHGSLLEVSVPDLSKGRVSTDFGKGFYTTSQKKQAETWALNKKKDKDKEEDIEAVVSLFHAEDELLCKDGLTIKTFDKPDEEWLRFVVSCRRGFVHQYDMVYGPVANDKIYTTINLYETGVLNAEETVARLKIKEYYNQISFHSEQAVRELTFIQSFVVRDYQVI
jgi:hypothetical protein